jgi:hypothetical protein
MGHDDGKAPSAGARGRAPRRRAPRTAAAKVAAESRALDRVAALQRSGAAARRIAGAWRDATERARPAAQRYADAR